jgi:putative ABC transport system permease protein
VVIVAQTIYAATVERLSSFATLRAIRASNAYLNSIVLKQALTGVRSTISSALSQPPCW